ncbi:DUF4998 domain-containing protein [Pedobacter nyackensis]|uniref:DUF4998 domain-containing protein n=1 Tax=Pedobacter nyackensis TaxID=475255 RepID=UPI00292E999D|nr:DUF4998 domain-containing protein [Pedobacter nyackensis]
MKTYLYLLLVLLVTGCTKKDDYKKYIDGEERVYRAKPSHLKILSGYNRALVTFKLYNPIHVNKYEIYADKVKIAEGLVEYADSVFVEKWVEDLEEKTYQIDVVTIDDDGQQSVKASGFLNVSGPRLQRSLNQRVISKALSTAPGELSLSFAEAASNVVRTKLVYTNYRNVVKTVYVDKKTKDTLLNDIGQTGTLDYSTFILPTSQSIDTIFSTTEHIDLSTVSSQWFSSEEKTGEGVNNGRVAHMFDNNISTFWHTQYVGATFAYPHWFIMDLGTDKAISSVFVTRRNGSNTLPTKIRVETKNIGGNWVSLGEYSLQNKDGEQQVNVSGTVSGRYLKITALQGPAAHTCIAEFRVL